jgi:hypothetical protein
VAEATGQTFVVIGSFGARSLLCRESNTQTAPPVMVATLDPAAWADFV